jgi:hypothetical protein
VSQEVWVRTTSGDSVTVTGTPATGAPDPLLAPIVLDSPDLLDSLGMKKRFAL